MASEIKVGDGAGVLDPRPEETSSSDIDGGLDTEAAAVKETTLLRKIDLQLLPAVGVLYLLSFLDRSNGKGCSDKEVT
jgi:hypothetical protein